jgi:hypothetical protein
MDGENTLARKNKEKWGFLWLFARLFVSLQSVRVGNSEWIYELCGGVVLL